MTPMRIQKFFLSPSILLLSLSFLVGCQMGIVPEESSLDFGAVYIVGTYQSSTPLENEATFAQSITGVTFDDGSAFSLAIELPFEMEQRTPYPINFRLSPVAESFGALSDAAHLTIEPKVGSPYEVIVNLSAIFIDGDLDDDGVVDVVYGGEDCDDTDPEVFGGLIPHEEVCDGKDNDCDGGLSQGELDLDQDGVICFADCDDQDADRYGGDNPHPEICDGKDNDCDGQLGIEELDGDLDGVTACDGDCEPGVASVFPGALEVCDGFDTDCDPTSVVAGGELDSDGDGHIPCSPYQEAGAAVTGGDDCDDNQRDVYGGTNPAPELCDGRDNDCDGYLLYEEVDVDQDGALQCNDCDDGDVTVFPGATELCNGVDDDCNGLSDASNPVNGIAGEDDADGDGSLACDDCDDGDATAVPGATELCDGLDNDCNGQADFGGSAANELDLDLDGSPACLDCDDGNAARFPGNPELCDGEDNDCDPTTSENADNDGDGVTACDNPSDCDDSDSTVSPGATELCDGLDNDCNGLPDFAGNVVNEVDSDGDGSPFCADCDDSNASNFPGNTELCDGLDNDCDTATFVDAAGEIDGDGDGSLSCADCDDVNQANFPGNIEACDGLDNDCDGSAGSDESDGDGDSVIACADCDDADAANFPGNLEVCDNQDNDCDVSTNEGNDNDGDGSSTCAGDCDDSNAQVYPGAPQELCDGLDNDCDGDFLLGEDADSDGDSLLDCQDNDCPHYVDDDFGGNSLGTQTFPWTTLAQGISEASTAGCNAINVVAGNYSGPLNWPSAIDLRVVGVDGAALTILSGNGTGPVVTIDGGQSGTALLQGFTITGGVSVGDAGGILVSGASPTLRGLSVQGNRATGNGGGLAVLNGSPHIDDNVFSGNLSASSGANQGGGGIYVTGGAPLITRNLLAANSAAENGGGLLLINPSGPLEISGNDFQHNHAADGGGAYLTDITGNVFQNVFEGNGEEDTVNGIGPTEFGGGIYLGRESTLLDPIVFSNNIFNANTGNRASAMYISNSSPQLSLTNNTFVDNFSPSGAAQPVALRIWQGSYRNNIFAFNSAFGIRIGSALVAPYGASGAAVLQNNDFFGDTLGDMDAFTDASFGIFLDGAGNQPGDTGYDVATNGYTHDLDGDGNPDFYDGQADGNILDDPQFTAFSADGDPLNDTLTLLSGSACIDAGTPDAAANDSDGTRADIGAFGGPLGNWSP